MSDDTEAYLKNIARDMQSIKSMMAEVITYMKDAESEIPEKMRRFIMYMHDVHDIKHLDEEHGQVPPTHVLREMERCDDRYRQLLEAGNTDLGWIERVRAEMSKDLNNRWDHSKLLPKHEVKR